MFRFSRLALRSISLAEATSILSATTSAPPALSDIIDVLSQYGQSVPIAKKALPILSSLDVADEVSQELATGAGFTAVLQAMKASPVGRIGSDLVVSEHCCRAIANMALVPGGQQDEAGTHPYADQLVAQDAVEMVLGVMTLRAGMLSLKGRCWVSMALLNLTMLSNEGAHRAVTMANSDATAIVATFAETLADEHVDTLLPAYKLAPSSQEATTHLQLSLMALDSTLGTLSRLLSLEAPDNAEGVTFRYQSASYFTLNAVSYCLRVLALNPPAVSTHFIDLELSILHKLWDIVRMVSSHEPRLSMVYDALHKPSLQPGEAQSSQNLPLHRVIEATIQRIQQSEGAEEGELQSVRGKCIVSFVEAATHLTTVRKDVDPNAGATEDISAYLPTEAATSVIDTVGSGAVAGCVVALIAQSRWTKDNLPTLRVDVSYVVKLLALLTNLGEVDSANDALNALTVVQGTVLERYLRESSLDVRREMLPAVGQTLSWIWTLLNTTAGCEAAKLYHTKDIVQRLVEQSKETIEAFSAAESVSMKEEQRHEASQADTATTTTTTTAAAAEPPVENMDAKKLAESFLRLGNQLLEKLDAAVENPRFAHSAVTGIGRK